MRADALDYELPAELIAQTPAKRRDSSRLLVVHRSASGGRVESASAAPLSHRQFADLPELLRAGDLLVLNDARVLPARVQATRAGGGRVELLFLHPQAGESRRCWCVLARPAKRVRAAELLRLVDGTELEVVAEGERGERTVAFPVQADPVQTLEALGSMPLPPYIRRDRSSGYAALDRRRYQTVYAASPGAVAAPTAGLHFTRELLRRLRENGVESTTLTLHVGPGTFRPIVSETVEQHRMDAERFELGDAAVDAIRRARNSGGRVIAVGTTAVRTLEYAARGGELRAATGSADLFIHPGYRFRVVDGMITNFHLPRSTPMLLVAAMIGSEPLLRAYRDAITRGYRFYSYGDAMLVLP